ncbi:hypothetical protein EV361DRAFT_978122 [Lentinula raphanica]|nr:hypothetical protein EV361DRAFT_978122 [Lentinula raphanica]
MPKPTLQLEDPFDGDEVDVGDIGTASPKGFALPTLKKHLSRKSSLDQLQVSSPSSPDPTKAVKRGPQLTRSATLPKVPQSPNKSAPLTAELDALEVDSTLLENIRRWILGIAVVNFDIDHAPIIGAIFTARLISQRIREHVNRS